MLVGQVTARPLRFPYQEAGLTPQQAAAHLLGRFSYGPLPGQVEEVARQGLESWVDGQWSTPPDSTSVSDSNGLAESKLRRAVTNPAQLHEVMVDFWFNHFNVSMTDDDCRRFVADYETRAIRPHALGSFLDLLRATSHHPAMLYYLDNAYSTWEPQDLIEVTKDPMHYAGIRPKYAPRPGARGLNENYARELLELHTLGVDGGYRQSDVTQLARILTGWTVEGQTGRFQFQLERHDPDKKRFLYQDIAPSGQQEGEMVLRQLALHDSTARHLARKLAIRFVSDQPPEALVERLRRSFVRHQGSTRAVLEDLLESPEFWAPSALAAKIKSPLELEASALRILGARPGEALRWQQQLAGMGQELYHCRPPTGWPDKAETWLSEGTLVQRLAFCHELAQQSDLSSLRAQLHLPQAAPSDAESALKAYASALLPGRETTQTVTLLLEAAKDPSYSRQVVASSRKRVKKVPGPHPQGEFQFTPEAEANIVGLLLGCPEFQRR